MKSKKLDIVRYLLGQNFYKSNSRIISHGDKNVNFTRQASKRYKQYF